MCSAPYTTSPGRDRLLEDLNPAQREAVTHGGGPLLVVAGAGTGKTRVLTRRVAWLVAGGLPPSAVLAITFTNKAASVLRERLKVLPTGYGVWAGTFHGFGAWMLRARGAAIGIDPDYTIADREDQRRLVKGLLGDQGETARGIRPADVVEMISLEKNGGSGRKPLDLTDPRTEEVYEQVRLAYTRRLRAANLLDFDDLLLESLRLLQEDEEAASHYRDRFAHVLVDEYQDTNLVQGDLTRALLGPAQNVTVVGDPDQSIYRWRGAAVRNILEFEQDFPGARKIVLERNYRSTRSILEAAEHVIAKNVRRHEKRLFTEREDGPRLREIRCRDADDEAQQVLDVVRGWQRDGVPFDRMAVFYRVNSLSRAIEMAFRQQRVPYVVVAGVEFFQRREVKDLLAYARLVENPDDDAAFLRVANVPRRGVGATSLQRLRRAAAERGVSCLTASMGRVERLSAQARKGLDALRRLVEESRRLDRAPVAPILERLAEGSGYQAWLEAEVEQDEIGQARLENLRELLAFARQFDREDEPEGDLRAFLERTALVSDQDALDDEHETGRVSLMSVHAAKGLEFPCVVIAGAELDLFPHGRSADDPEGEEEERRLFYVAMTRAMERLVLTHAARRFTFRGEEPRLPTPYLRDVPEHLRERVDRVGSGWGGYGSERLFSDDPSPGDDLGFVRETDSPFEVGDRVRHPYFGEGLLRDHSGQGPDARVTVDFVGFGRKQLLLRHARLERA